MKRPPSQRPERLGMSELCNIGFGLVAVCAVMIMADPKLASPSAGIAFVLAVGLLYWRLGPRKGRQGVR